MIKIKTYLLRFQAFVLSIFVAILSMGFTYQWEVCLYADEALVCKILENADACCCTTQIETPQCACADMGDNTCDISFSKYVQFDFEVLTNNFQDLVPDILSIIKSPVYGFSVSTEFCTLLRDYKYSLPPPKSGRLILCFIQTFLI
tara:strand:+ start:552 stop:989 length:438 start_codon:yes stop_codon:yes gene_type:complete